MKKNKGFTLIELLISIALIVLLISIISVNFYSGKSKSRDIRRISELTKIRDALESYYHEYEEYPEPPVDPLWSSDSEWAHFIPEEYIKQVPADPLNKNLGNCESTANCLVYRYCRPAPDRYVIIANLENPLESPLNNHPECSHGGPNHYWLAN